MNETSTAFSRQDGIVTAIGILTLVMGGATGNAIAMFALSLLTIAFLTIYYRNRLNRKVFLVVIVTFVVSFIIAITVVAIAS